jgi:hypothetical protein
VAARSARFLIEDSVQLITIELTAHFAASKRSVHTNPFPFILIAIQANGGSAARVFCKLKPALLVRTTGKM